MSRRRCVPLVLLLLGSALAAPGSVRADVAAGKIALQQIGVQRGLCVLLGQQADLAIPLAQQSELTIFVQSASSAQAAALRLKADAAGLLGTRVYVHEGSEQQLLLADDLADAILVGKDSTVPRAELLRVLQPGAKALGAVELVKPATPGSDDWTHPYHGPDNNPQSADRVARRPFITHFLAEPWYCPLTQMTVAAGGRLFKAFGDRSSARPQEALLGKLLALNAYNGTTLWMRDLSPGFMIHRNTMIATPETLFLGDDRSCKLIDTATGKVRDEMVVPEGIAEGPVWKWMGMEKGVLFALVGEKETPEIPLRGERIRGAGWPWWKYSNYQYGFGRTLLAIDPQTKKILWHHREKEPLDGRAMALKNGRLYFYSDGKFLACLETSTGKVLWKNSAADLLRAIGPHGAAQHPMLGFASTAFLKVGADALFFAGPQRPRLVAASTRDGKLLWQHEGGNVQLVLRDEGLYALGEGRINSKQSSLKLDPLSGKILSTFASRDRCTRATGCLDSIFTRGGSGGSTAVFDVTASEPQMGVLAPMRPACTDGVVVANGYLYWGPWMCACDQTQIGCLSLGPAANVRRTSIAARLEMTNHQGKPLTPFPVTAEDWPTYRHDETCSAVTSHVIPGAVRQSWEYKPPHQVIATAPTTAGGLIFVSGADGIVRALEAARGKPRWSAFTGGQLKYPPVIAQNRAYVGSGDGWVYCLEAASGRQLWRHRVAPAERIMPVHGTLTSTWPVGSGVLVQNGVVYAAAGIFNYDGTHVCALDALTGKLRWENSTTGALDNPAGKADGDVPQGGVSVQGHLLLHEGKIWMPAGNRPTIASYAVADGKFAPGGQGRGKHLYLRANQVKATGFPLHWRPEDDHHLTPLELEMPDGVLAISTGKLGRFAANAGVKEAPLWTSSPFHEIAGVAIGKNAVVVAGVKRNPRGQVIESGVCALSLMDGKQLWRESLPAMPVAWGVALDRRGQIVVSLFDGRVVAFAGR